MSQSTGPSPSSLVAPPGMPGSSASADLSLQQIADMDVDVEDSLVVDHEAPTEKTDADFFNGTRASLPCIAHSSSDASPTLRRAQTSRTTLMTKISEFVIFLRF